MTTSCMTLKRSGIEPVWKPRVYLFSAVDGRCRFVRGKTDKIECDDPLIHDMALVPLEDIEKLEDKHQRCEVWR